MQNFSEYKNNTIEIAIFTILLLGTILTSFYSFLLFHCIAELYSIIIAAVIFVIAWTMRREIDNSFYIVLGISSLFIGMIDLIHTLAYKGMNIFIGYDANLPTQLWIAARYLQAFSILFASLVVNKKLNHHYTLILGYSIITSVLIILSFLRIFPDCYVEGSGLTTFKIVSEYIIIFIIFIAILKLYKIKDEFEKTIFYLIIGSLLTTIFAELAFTFYVSVYGLSNLIGHIFKIITFYLIYKAIIQIGLREPENLLFRKLNISEKKYRKAYDSANFYKDLFVHDISNIFQTIHSSVELVSMVLSKPEDLKKLNERMGLMKDSVGRGMKLISNVRKLSLLEDSEIPIHPTELCFVLNESIKFLHKIFHDKDIILQVDPPENKLYVKANDLLLDVFENILINAAKFNDNSKIYIFIKVLQVQHQGMNYIRLEFMDNGIGISDTKKNLIFQKKVKKDLNQKGMGIGLSLVKKIIDSYNGKIWVEDKVKGHYSKGSNFILLIPEAI